MLSFKFTAKKVWREIDRSSKILLHIHPGPDADSVGSSLAMYHVLKSLNKDITLIQGDNDLPKNLITLPGSDKIIPKNIFQIDLDQYDLFLILDSSSLKQVSRLGAIKFPKKLKTICIDHHISSEKFAHINLICPTSPATCQVLFDFLQLRKIKITNKIAACLFAGIYTDTGGFKYLNTTHKTLNIVSQLAKIYPQFTKLIFDIENTDEPDRLKLISILLGSIETYFNNTVAIASISFDQIEKNKLSSSSINGNSDVSNMIKSVVGWDIALTLTEIQPETVKISLRTRNSQKYDLAKIAVATKLGGGHKAAAGATLNMSLSQAKETILAIIKKLYPKIGKI